MLILKSSNGRRPSELAEEHLQLVSSWLLDEWRATEDDLVRDTDTAYTRGTARFGRQKQRIQLEWASGRHPWLHIMNGGLDIVFTINGIPCRFSNDDADAPKKRAVLETHMFQMPLLEEAEPGEAARFVFVLDRGFDESSDPRVVLLGFTSAGEAACRWTSDSVVRRMGEATPSLPAPVDVPKPTLSPKRQRGGEDDAVASAGP
ncbi:MAG: hypothetical protein QM777_25620 [Pseudorhodoferax sp.]